MTLISIIIPFYSGERFLPLLLNSLKESIQLCVGSMDFEVIVVVDSIETNVENIEFAVVNTFKFLPNVQFLVEKNKENIGVAASRNFGISIAKGGFLHLIDQDDQISPAFYPSVILSADKFNFILFNGEVSYTSEKNSAHKIFYFAPDLSIKALICDDFIRSPGQVVFSKSLCSGFGFPVPKESKGADDRFFFIKLFLRNLSTIKIEYVKEPLYKAYIHDDNFSADAINLKKSALENWVILQSEEDLKSYLHFIKSDINRLKFSVGSKMSKSDKIDGFFQTLRYFSSLNKIVRFLAKCVNHYKLIQS